MVNKFQIAGGMVLFLFLTALFSCSTGVGEKEIQGVAGVNIVQHREPLLIGREHKPAVEVSFTLEDDGKPWSLTRAELTFDEGSRFDGLSAVSVQLSDTSGNEELTFPAVDFDPAKAKVKVTGKKELGAGTHVARFFFHLKENPDLLTALSVNEVKLHFQRRGEIVVQPSEEFVFRPALVLRAAGQDSCDTYRIPGLVTTNEGTLIAVYDNRYNNSKDLQEDIDIGMSRSTDGGRTWEPMKVIMDMGEYGGLPHRLNGIGDPCVLYDPINHTLWVAASWMSGGDYTKMLWWTSKPGMAPEETGQFVLVKSTDDGLTWSDPISITGQIKDPAWQYLLQGPGRGITLSDGTLVFPAQFKADIGEKAIDGGPYTCHSTIVYSQDGGNSWHIGTGAKSNTTEAQVVELADGSLMINMRDDRNRIDKGDTNGRAVATTTDLGKTWTIHPTSNNALPEPNCMASIISADVAINGVKQQVLFFSNPDNKEARTNMTIKASFDGGLTWPEAFHAELNAAGGYGYSCMTMADENNIGILYEGNKELYFQKIPVKDIVNDHLNY